MNAIVRLGVLALVAAPSTAQQFAELGRLHLPLVDDSVKSVLASDDDGDGDLDLWLYSHRWTNEGGARFSIRSAGPIGPARALGDLDGDGDPDLVFGEHELHLNDGAGSFTVVPGAPFGFWGNPINAVLLDDVDGDSDLDVLFVNGEWELGHPNRLFLNDGAGHFIDASAQLPNHSDDSKTGAFGDVDGDGDLDLVIGNDWHHFMSGHVGDQNRLYLNNGSGFFVDATSWLVDVDDRTTSMALLDVDGDGDLDLITGNTDSSRVDRNDGTGHFFAAPSALPPDVATGLATADVDGDGDPDLMLAGGRERLYRNDGAGLFTNASAALLPVAEADSLAVVLADFDGDGDADAFVGTSHWKRLYLNRGDGTFADATARHMPTPNGKDIAAAVVGDVDNDGDQDLVTSSYISLLPDTPVAHVFDNDGRGWFAQRPITASDAGTGDVRAIALGDVDGDGDLDVLLGRKVDNGLCLNNGTGVFLGVTTTHLPPVSQSVNDLALGDVDGDEDLDLVCANSTQSRLFSNDGSGVFADVTGTQMPVDPAATTNVAIGDVDGDGDLDLVFGAWRNRLYLNDGAGWFRDASNQLPGDLTNHRVTLGDVDGDGDLDVLCANRGAQNGLYLNDGAGWFIDATATHLPPLGNPTNVILAADLDGDGDLDQYCATEAALDRLWLNDGTGHFVDASSRLPGVSTRTWTAALADVDGDGDLDVFASGPRPTTGTPSRENRLLLNLQRHIDTPYLLLAGQGWVVAAHAWSTAPMVVVPMCSTVPANVPIPSLGLLGLDPSVGIPLGWYRMLPPGGIASTVVPIPALPGLVGISMYCQALVIEVHRDLRLTNVTADALIR